MRLEFVRFIVFFMCFLISLLKQWRRPLVSCPVLNDLFLFVGNFSVGTVPLTATVPGVHSDLFWFKLAPKFNDSADFCSEVLLNSFRNVYK